MNRHSVSRVDPACAVSTRFGGRYLGTQALVALGFLASAAVASLFILPVANVPLLWPASGLALALVYRLGNRCLLGVGLGALLAFGLKSQALLPTLAMTAGTLGGVLLGAQLLRRLAVDGQLSRPRDVLGLLAAVIATGSVTSLVGASTMYLSELSGWPALQPLWWVCWVADVGGGLLLAPLLLSWNGAVRARQQRLEWLLLAAAVAGLATLVYAELVPPATAGLPLSYLVFPLLIAAALRLGPRELSLLLLLHAAIAFYYTAHSSGPFAGDQLRSSLLSLHALLAVLGASMLLLTAARQQQRADAAALHEREAQYRLLVDHQTDLLLKLTIKGGVLFASPSASAALGPSNLAKLGQELVGGADLKALEHGRPVELERLAATPQGERWINWVLSPAQEAGKPVLIAVGRDVSDRHRAEQQARRHLDELARAGRIGAMGELAAGLAHELNQPLCAISNYASAGLRLLPPAADPDLREVMQGVAANAARAGGIISQMRAFVRKDHPVEQPADVNQLIHDVLGLAASDARHHHVELRTELSAALPPVKVVPIQIQQVLLNLIRNAIEAMAQAQGAPGAVTVTSGQVGDRLEIRVSDGGPGLPPKLLEQAFEPFVTTKAGGMGLGLSISRSIAEAHQGGLEAHNLPAGGSEFRLWLPVATAGRSEE